MLSLYDQQIAVDLVGDTAEGLLAAKVQAIASQYNNDARYPGYGLDLLYVQRDLLKIKMNSVWDQVTIKDGDQTQNLSDRFTHLKEQYATVLAEIMRVEKRALVSGPVLVGMITATTPEPAPFVGGLDAGSTSYRGDPYYPYAGGAGMVPVRLPD